MVKLAAGLRRVDARIVEDVDFAYEKESKVLSEWTDIYEKEHGRKGWEDDWDFSGDDFGEVDEEEYDDGDGAEYDDGDGAEYDWQCS